MDASHEQTALTALRQLVGLQMRDGKRAADMKMFAFGEDVEVLSPRNSELQVVAQRMFHVQCSWRLLAGDLEIASDQDWANRKPGQSIDEVDEGVIVLLGARKPVVNSVDMRASREVRIGSDDGVALLVIPDGEDGEQWRLLQVEMPGTGEELGRRGPHVVVERVDGELVTFVD